MADLPFQCLCTVEQALRSSAVLMQAALIWSNWKAQAGWRPLSARLANNGVPYAPHIGPQPAGGSICLGGYKVRAPGCPGPG